MFIAIPILHKSWNFPGLTNSDFVRQKGDTKSKASDGYVTKSKTLSSFAEYKHDISYFYHS